jgi:lipoate-protein ligase A
VLDRKENALKANTSQLVSLLSKELNIDKKQIKADLIAYCEQVVENISNMFLARTNATPKDDFGRLSDELWAKEKTIKKFAKLVIEREAIIKDTFLKDKETIQYAAGLFAED